MHRSPASPPSIVGFLPLHNCQVHITASVSSIAERFKQNLALPGVIVTDGMNMIGVVSRRRLADYARFCAAAARPPTSADYSKMILLPLELPDTCPILEAVQQVIQRSSETASDPLVIKFPDGSRRLLDFRTLMASQMQILAHLQQKVQAQQAEVQDQTTALQQAQRRVGELEQALQAQVAETTAWGHLLHQHRTQLQQQITTTAASNDRLNRLQAVLSKQGQKSFQSTLTAVQAISYRTACIKEISIALAREVETIYTVASVVKQISRQARFLSLRAAVLANRWGPEAQGLGQVTADFGQLSQQATKASQQLEETVKQLRGRHVELMHLAQAEAKVTKALTHNATNAETVLVELDHLLAASNDLAQITASNSLLKRSGILKRRSNLHKIDIEEQTLSRLTDSIDEPPTLIDFNPKQ